MIAEGCAHSLSRFDFAGEVLGGFVGRHAEFNLSDCSNVKIAWCLDRFGKGVGNSGSKHIEHVDEPATAKRVGF